MKTFKFNECSVPGQYAINLRDRYMMTFVDSRTQDIFRSFFAAIADVLKIHQNKNNEKTVLVITDSKNQFKFGAIMSYHKPEEGEEEDSGNWYLTFTFDEDDVKGIEPRYDVPSIEFNSSVTQECFNIASCRFATNEYIYKMLECAFDTIIDFLDANAVEGDTVELVMNGVFTASVVIEDGEKIMSIVPGEVIKQIIKGDSIL